MIKKERENLAEALSNMTVLLSDRMTTTATKCMSSNYIDRDKHNYTDEFIKSLVKFVEGK